ncbi:hypothetical protein B0H13DRAFT_2676389 [Mycena leptocephala]|nr:hypothetical protein B0H13DRAFT_2676389 [Mycena leptocephala]
MRSPFSLWISFVFVWTSLLVLLEGKPLVPYKNAPQVLPRSAWKREVVPKDVVTLSAYENVPIMVLEEIDFLVETIVCHITLGSEDSVVEIIFTSEDAYAAIFATWSSLSEFILVTSHQSCNPNDQRGAWLVSSVFEEAFKYAISLEVHSIPLREIGSSFHISHASDTVSTGWRSRNTPQLKGRDTDLDKILPFDNTFDFAPRQQILPINISQIEGSSNDLPDPLGLQVFCIDCVSVLNFSVGLEMDISGDSVTEAWVNFTINEFEHDIDLEISLNDAHTFNEVFDFLRLPVPDLGVSIQDVFTIGLFWGGAVRTDLTIAAAVNFTVGASAKIPSGATATFVATDLDKSSAVGWDKATFDIHPFRLNNGSFSVTAGISLSPFLEATIAFGLGTGSSARLYLNTPHIGGTATIATSVNRDCLPLGPNDFETFKDALTFGAGLNISIFLTKGFPFGDLPTLDKPNFRRKRQYCGAAASADRDPARCVGGHSEFQHPGIESYYSAHGTLPTSVNYTQMLMATTVPDDIKGAAQHHPKAGVIAGSVIGSLAIVVLAAIGIWYLRFRRPKSEHAGEWVSGGLPKTGPAVTPGSQMEGKDYMTGK